MTKLASEIENILNLIYSESCSGNDIAMLFIYLRQTQPTSLVRELGDFMAHPKRDQGTSHELIDKYIKNIVEVSAKGGSIQSKRLAETETIIKEVVGLLKKILSSFDEEQFELRKKIVIARLFEKLDKIEFEFNDPKIKSCVLKNDGGKMLFCFNLNLPREEFRWVQEPFGVVRFLISRYLAVNDRKASRSSHVLRSRPKYLSFCYNQLMNSHQLLFLHGAGSSDKDRAKYLQDLLKKYNIESYSFNFSGHGGIGLEHSSLEKRLIEVEEAIKKFNLQEPLNICGSSMGGYIALKLLEKYQVKNLILFCPAVYDDKAFTIPFGEDFTNIIRKKDSWRNSHVFSSLQNFKGRSLIVMGEEDEVIPKELVTLLKEGLKNALSQDFLTIPTAPHAIHRFLSKNDKWQEKVTEKVASLF